MAVSNELTVLVLVIAVLALASVAYLLLVVFSPRDPPSHPSELTYLTPSSPDAPRPLPSLLSTTPSVELSVVVPAYNESLRLAFMLRPAIKFLETRSLDDKKSVLEKGVERGSYEVLIVDDGSRDDTVKVALKLAGELESEFGATRGRIKVCSLVKNRGKGGATKHGVLHAAGQRILFVDADGATHFPDLASLEAELDAVESNQSSSSSSKFPGPHGIVVGSRAHLVRTEAVVKRSLLRNLLMRSFHLYLSLLGLSSIRDTQCGFKLHARSSARLLYPSLHSPGWIFDCELLLLAQLCGVPLREVGVRWEEVGGSKLDVVWDSARMARDLLIIRGNYLMGRWTRPGTDTLWTDPSLRILARQSLMNPLANLANLPTLPHLSPASLSSPPRSALSASAASSNPLVSSTTPPASEEPSPTDLLLATPPTLLKLFALSAPIIHAAATFCQLVTWQHPSFFASLLVLLGWWALCLFGRWIALYGLNAVILVYILSTYFSTARRANKPSSATTSPSSSAYRHARPPTLTPAAYAQLLTSAHFLFAHLQTFRTTVIHPLSLQFHFGPLRPSTPAPAYTTARLLVTSYPAYLLLTYLVPLRYILLVVGTVAILWQAPFFRTLRTLLWRSAAVRWACRLALGVLCGGKGVREEWARTKSGVGVPGLLGRRKYGAAKTGLVEEKTVKKARRASSVSKVGVEGVIPEAGEDVLAGEDIESVDGDEDVQVQFTVFENQRWWVGLDWTHALLPGERASWTDPSSNPSNPPSSFLLPPPQIVYIPSPTPADPNSRLKKTTEWRWLDPEWRVLRNSIPSVALPAMGSPAFESPPATSAAAAGRPSPPASPSLPGRGGSTPASSLLRSTSPASSRAPPSSPPPPQAPSLLAPASLVLDPHSTLFATWIVDAEGWQYGDNHFEKMGPRGGLGKYTRRRAWVRRAGLRETVERVPGEAVEPGEGKKEGGEREGREKGERSRRRRSDPAEKAGGAAAALRRRKGSMQRVASGEESGHGVGEEGSAAGG
ncbi:hypothetical protein JCM1841_005271 [Sporobolomyces salmonicolor]